MAVRHTTETRINVMRGWVNRREVNKKSWTEDELWSRIKTNWPTLTEEEHEAIFQGCIKSKPAS